MTNKLKNGIARVDASLLMQTLVHIDSHGGVTSIELAEVTGLSPVSVKRLIGNARRQYGVVIIFRRDNSMPTHGGYQIEDWGVFDKVKVFYYILENYRNDV